MNVENIRNPFETTKATDFTDRQILEYWVDLIGHDKLEGLLQPSSAMPMLILGSKGCGKTHLLRYSSYSVRRLRWNDRPIDGIRSEGFIGVYLRADGLNASRFAGKGVPADRWQALFRYYFESWIAQLSIETCDDALRSQKTTQAPEAEAVRDILALYDRPFVLPAATLQSLRDALIAERKDLDFAINNAAFTHDVNATIRLTPGRLLFDASEILAQLVGSDTPIRFLYLLDELENFTDDQQRFVNSLIRYRRGSSSFRIGARLYGIRTVETDNAGESNKEGAEFEVLRLDTLIRESDGYRQCARLLCAKRLIASGYVSSGQSVDALAQELPTFFEEPPKDPLAVAETLRLVEKYEERERPYLTTLRKQLSEYAEPPLSTDAVNGIMERIYCSDTPILEKLNCLLLYQDWSRGERLSASAEAVHKLMVEFKDGVSKAGRYSVTLGHFKSDLLAQLYRECKVRPEYPGFAALIDMSGGVPRNLLGLLKHIVRRAEFNGEQPFRKGKISRAAQRDGIRDAAAWFIEDAQPDQHGTEVRSSINALGELLREIRFSNKPVECTLSTISLDEAALAEAAARVIRHAENWSFLLKLAGGAKEKNSKAIVSKFQLNPLLAPRWDLPVSRRGTYALGADLANSMFDPSQRQRFAEAMQVRIAKMNVPFNGTISKTQELKLGASGD